MFRVQDGFQKLFNLWEDEDSIRATAATGYNGVAYEIPAKATNVINEDEYLEGDTLVQGTTSKTLRGSDGQ